MAMTKGLPTRPDQKPMNKTQARRSLSAKDKIALPFITKKCRDQNNPQFGMWQEDRLVMMINERLRLSDTERRQRVDRCTAIDTQLSGIVVMDDKQKKDARDNARGKKPKAVPISLTLGYAQLDEAVTYCMSVFAPEMDMFIASSSAEKQNVAEGLTKVISKQGAKLQYYREIAKMVLNALKYNFGGVTTYWETQTGKVFTADTNDGAVTGQLTKKDGVLWEGNVIRSIDAYNFFYDTAVHPVDLALRGEYFAIVEPYTPFRVKRMAEQNILFGIDRYINETAALSTADSGTYYIAPPIVREPYPLNASTGGVTNWQQILSPGTPAKQSQPSIELVWHTAWVLPIDYDLSDSTELEVWRFCMANGKYITSAVHIEDTHGQLPCSIATPIEDDLRNDQRTYAEQLMPLQQFASFLLNTHVDASRKAIYGITVFDANLFPGIDMSTEDMIGMRIPMKSSATGIDIDKAFRHYNEAPNTDQNVDMVVKIVELMQLILPTNAAKQVADLERATEYQAAATVQASNRRNLKIARLINDQCLSVLKFQMLYNIYAKMTVIEYIDNKGQPQQITPAQLFEAQIEFDVGTGLKGLDRLMQIQIFKDIMGYIFQTPQAVQQVDVLALLTYMAQIAGFQTDLTQFKSASQQPTDAQGNPIPQQPQITGPANAPANAA